MSAVPFQNRYTHRTAAKESSCWVCGKFTTAVLTHKDVDWFYVCINHIKDTSFCKPIVAPIPTPPASSTSTGQPLKSSSNSLNDGKKSKEKSSEDKDDNADDNNQKKKEKSTAQTPPAAVTPPTPPPPKDFILDSKIFFLRESEYRKKIQLRNAKQVNSKLPTVPRAGF